MRLYDKDADGDKRFITEKDGRVATGRVYEYDTPNGKVKIEEHSAGHVMDKQMQETGHFNVRDADGKTLKGAKEHYYFNGRLNLMRYFWQIGGRPVPRGPE